MLNAPGLLRLHRGPRTGGSLRKPNPMHIDGQCLCGHVTFEAEVDPQRVAICHCTDCQFHSGTAFGVVAGIDLKDFRLLSGSLKTHVKTADSGNKRDLTFCPECGTRIYAGSSGATEGFVGLRLGTVRQRAELPPTLQVWCQSQQPWTTDLSTIPERPPEAGAETKAGEQ